VPLAKGAIHQWTALRLVARLKHRLLTGQTPAAASITNRPVLRAPRLVCERRREVVVSGIRNMVGFTLDPSGAMFGVVNGMDDLSHDRQDIHLDNPRKDVIGIQPGTSQGRPYCFTAQHVLSQSGMIAPGTQLASTVGGLDNPRDDGWCAENANEPVSFLPAHSAPSTSFSRRLSRCAVFSGGSAEGPVDGAWGRSAGDAGEDPVRPDGVAVSPPDGAIYVSSDGGGVLYRIGQPLE
jgi:glucose/arabinose dehydrogenase